MSGFLRLLFSLVLLAVAASPEAADNLMVNAGFDRDLGGWRNPFSREAVWVAEDAGGRPDSGAVRLRDDTAGNGGTLLVLEQCLPSVGGRRYVFGGKIRVPAGQPSGVDGNIFLTAYAQPNCSGSLTFNNVGSAATSWTTVSRNFTTPDGTASVRLAFGVRKAVGVNDPGSVLFDDLLLRVDPPQGFTLTHHLSGSWYNPAWNGQGFFLDVAPAIDVFFAGWYAWTSVPGEYVWLTAQGTMHGDTAHVPLYQTTGGVLLDPRPVTTRIVGTASFRFTSCTQGLVQIFWEGRPMATFPLVRLTPPPPGCPAAIGE